MKKTDNRKFCQDDESGPGRGLTRGMMERKQISKNNTRNFEVYFKTGVSSDYILMSRDFPMQEISPSDFSKLILRMFKENEEALRNGK